MRDHESAQLRWYDVRRVRLTREYCAGIIAGLGLGIMVMGYVDSFSACPGWTLKFILGMALIPVGSSWQYRLTCRKDRGQPERGESCEQE